MESISARAYFRITNKGRGQRAQALLQRLREGAESAEHGSFSIAKDAGSGGTFYFYVKAPGEIAYELGSQKSLPAGLAVLRPLRVHLTGSGHFNFPVEGVYEGGAEVAWRSQLHNTSYDAKGPVVAEHTWTVTIDAATVEEAYDLLARIRTGEAPMTRRWANHLPLSVLRPTGSVEVDDDDPDSRF